MMQEKQQYDGRVNVRVNSDVRDKAEAVFKGLGLNLSSGINLYLNQVVASRGLPFKPVLTPSSVLRDDLLEQESKIAAGVKDVLQAQMTAGVPIARFDTDKGVPYLEYADGHRDYDYAQ